MARRPHDNPTAEALEELEHLGDRIVERVSANPGPVLGALALILIAAAGYGGFTQYRESRDGRATAALERVRGDYLEAMGAGRSSVEVPEPANPETARRVRSEYAERFAAVAEEHARSPAAALALKEVGELRLRLGERDAALASWRRAAEAAVSRPGLRGLLLESIAQAEEDAGRFAEAAAAYEEAGETSGYPLRYEALGHAARCRAEAGETEKAVALYKRVRAESPQTQLPDHITARLRELEVAAR